MREVLFAIAGRALSLDDRLAGMPLDLGDVSNAIAGSRLERWRETVAHGDRGAFAARLEMESIAADALPSLLAPARLRESRDEPAWIALLGELIRATAFTSLDGHTGRKPFDEILTSYVDLAASKLRARDRRVSAAAMEALEATLLLGLSRICARPLVLELNVARLRRSLAGDTPEARYVDFVRRTATPEGMLRFFAEYAVAARLVVVAVTQWIEATDEFLDRLETDLLDIETTFGDGTASGEVTAIVDQISDSHNGNRTARLVTFASGLRVVYKPKDLTLDEAFQELLLWIGEHASAGTGVLPLARFRVLNRRTHGWVEFLQPAPCRDAGEIDRYFRRAGMLLALVHALGGTDCNHENIFACGEHPILIDLETLLDVHPSPPADRPDAEALARQEARQSLLQTGMLPRLVFGDPGAAGADFSGLMTGTAPQQYPFRLAGWVDVGTDRMRLDFTYRAVASSPSRLVLDGEEVSAHAHQSEIEDGFEGMYLALLASRDALQASALLDRLCAGSVRYLNRPTVEYALIQQKSLDPALLRDGIERSVHLDLLYRNLFAQDKEAVAALVPFERQALERLDIPYFSADARSSTLMSDRRFLVSGLRVTPARDRLRARLAHMSQEEMQRQLRLMRANWAMRDQPGASVMPPPAIDGAVLDESALIDAAAAIGERIARAAIRAEDGTVTWIGAEYVPHLHQFSLLPVGSFLYSGKSGIALFLAALDRVVPGRGYAHLARGAMTTVRARLLGGKGPLYARAVGVGVFSGLASASWTLLQLADLLHDPALVDDAAAIGALIAPDLTATDRHLDIVSGGAGAVLGLLALGAARPAADFVRRADAWGQHLLERSVLVAPGARAWPSVRGERLAGFSHGAAGCACALSQLFLATGRVEYREAAREALGYERTLFSAAARNWPDLRAGDRLGDGPSFMTGWCHGAPGAALARLGCLAAIGDEAVSREIEIALTTTLEAPVTSNDDLCCGNFARIDTLLSAAMALDRPALRRAALTRASVVVSRAASTGSFRLDPAIDDALNPGFMKGIAGIGYALLRLTSAGRALPTPLLMPAGRGGAPSLQRGH